MITYAALNLRKKRFQVGSTTNFPRRQADHLRDKNTIPFLNDLRNHPEDFLWFVSVDDGLDDGLDDRSEEQHYLDFYFGSKWCYNLNPDAVNPPNLTGHKFSEETLTKRSNTRKGNNYGVKGENHPMFGKNHSEESNESNRQSHLGRSWINNGKEERTVIPGSELPEGFVEGRLYSPKGMLWWVNQYGDTTKTMESPGEGWKRGRKWQ
jgi:hypothetical protein